MKILNKYLLFIYSSPLIFAAALVVLIILSAGCTIHSAARSITYIALELAEADLDETNKVKDIAEIGLSMVVASKDPEAISKAIYELIESRFAGSGQGFIRLIYADVGDMIMSRIDIDLPDEYREGLRQAFSGVKQGAELYLRDLEQAE